MKKGVDSAERAVYSLGMKTAATLLLVLTLLATGEAAQIKRTPLQARTTVTRSN